MSSVLERFRKPPAGKHVRAAHDLERYTKDQVYKEKCISKRRRLSTGMDLLHSARKINRTVRETNGIYLDFKSPEYEECLRARIKGWNVVMLDVQDFLEMLRLLDEEHRQNDPPDVRKWWDGILERWVGKALEVWSGVKERRDSERKDLANLLSKNPKRN